MESLQKLIASRSEKLQNSHEWLSVKQKNNLRQTAAEFNILTRENKIRKRWAEKFRNPEQYANQNLHQRFTKNKA